MPGEARWKPLKKEKQEAPPVGGGMGLTPSMAEDIAAEHGVSSAELAEFAEFMSVDIVKESYLLGIVVEAMKAPLPEFWIECEDMTSGQYYYCNTQTRQTTWEHPLDKYFKNLLFVERRKYKERAKQGHRAVQGSAGVTTKAQEQYLKAQLEEKVLTQSKGRLNWVGHSRNGESESPRAQREQLQGVAKAKSWPAGESSSIERTTLRWLGAAARRVMARDRRLDTQATQAQPQLPPLGGAAGKCSWRVLERWC